jgi:hypothetical protein
MGLIEFNLRPDLLTGVTMPILCTTVSLPTRRAKSRDERERAVVQLWRRGHLFGARFRLIWLGGAGSGHTAGGRG